MKPSQQPSPVQMNNPMNTIVQNPNPINDSKKKQLIQNINQNNQNNYSKIRKPTNIDYFYKKYERRDKRFITEPKFENYLVQVLPNEFDNDKQIQDNVKIEVNSLLNNIPINQFNYKNINIYPTTNVDELKMENKEELAEFLKQTVDNMDILNSDGKNF